MGHAMRRAASRRLGFDPLSLSPKAWWDASDAATITLSGANVTAWADKSGNGYTLTPGTSPTYATAAQNGLNVVEFNGTNQYLTSGASLTGHDRTCFAVLKRVSGTGYQGIVQSSYYGMIVNITDSVLRHWAGNSALNNTTAMTSWTQVTTKLKNSVTRTHDTWANGGDHRSSSGFSAAETGETLLVGGVNFGGGPLQVAEIIWYWSLLSDTDRQAVEAYLKAKWGTP
jgi:hypothetical protein